MKTSSLIFDLPSDQIDLHFGFKINEIENRLLNSARALRPDGKLWGLGQALHGGHQTWVGLDPQTLNTPYSELVEICHLLGPSDRQLIIDLGAGYGRLGIVLKELYPEVSFLGFELVPERVLEGQRVFELLGRSKNDLLVQDLTDEAFNLPVADHYFLYDFGDLGPIRKVLNQLEKIADKKSFKVVARGKGSRGLIDLEYPWLSQINPVTRRENFSLYSF